MFADGCGGVAYDPPDMAGLYNRVARSSEYRNAVIVIPGILGSKLVDKESGSIVWGAFEGGYANPKDPEGARLIVLPMKEEVPLSELKDGVYPNGALDRVKVRVLGLPYYMNAYVHILSTLGVAGYRDEYLGDHPTSSLILFLDVKTELVKNSQHILLQESFSSS